MIGIECKWECPSCGNIIRTEKHFEDLKAKSPVRCSCGRKGKFRLLDFKRIDFVREVNDE